MSNGQLPTVDCRVLGFTRRLGFTSRFLFASNPFADLNAATSLLTLWHWHAYLQNTVAEARLDIFILYAFGQRDAAIEATVAALAAVEAFFVLFAFLPAFTLYDERLTFNIYFHIISG